jgi:hypothetical protein
VALSQGLEEGTGTVRNVSQRDGIAARVFMVIELEYTESKLGTAIRSVTSLPGQVDTIRYNWDLPAGVPNAEQLRDIAATVTRQTEEAVLTYCGSQGTLPGLL